MALASVNLQTKRTPLGLKDYIAVGTGVSRGEDLAERGAVRPTLPLSFSADWSLLNPPFTLYCAFPDLHLRGRRSRPGRWSPSMSVWTQAAGQRVLQGTCHSPHGHERLPRLVGRPEGGSSGAFLDLGIWVKIPADGLLALTDLRPSLRLRGSTGWVGLPGGHHLRDQSSGCQKPVASWRCRTKRLPLCLSGQSSHSDAKAHPGE